MINEFHLFAGTLTLFALVLSASFGHLISGMAYPGVGAPLFPDGPLRKLLYVNVAYLGVCGLLRLVGV